MKKLAHLLFLSLFVIGSNVVLAQKTTGKKPVVDSVTAYNNFMAQSKAKIQHNEQSIDSLKTRRDRQLELLKTKYDAKIDALETKNKALEQKVKEMSPNNWQAMQTSLNNDMNAFEQFLIRHDADD